MEDADDREAVLIVDDDRGWALLIGDEVRDAGFYPKVARTVEEARERLEQGEDISLVVLDVLFGETLAPKGIDLARWMKQHKEWRHVPIVFCTVVSAAEVRAGLGELSTGAEYVFEKPFDFAEFSETLKSILHQGGQ